MNDLDQRETDCLPGTIVDAIPEVQLNDLSFDEEHVIQAIGPSFHYLADYDIRSVSSCTHQCPYPQEIRNIPHA